MSKEVNARRRAKQLHKKAMRDARKLEKERKRKDDADLIQSVVNAFTRKSEMSPSGHMLEMDSRTFRMSSGLNYLRSLPRGLGASAAHRALSDMGFSSREIAEIRQLYFERFPEVRRLYGV